MDRADECDVCFTALTDRNMPVATMPCRKTFHAFCLAQWFLTREYCPHCRIPVYRGRISFEWPLVFRKSLEPFDVVPEGPERAETVRRYIEESGVLSEFRRKAEREHGTRFEYYGRFGPSTLERFAGDRRYIVIAAEGSCLLTGLGPDGMEYNISISDLHGTVVGDVFDCWYSNNVPVHVFNEVL